LLIFAGVSFFFSGRQPHRSNSWAFPNTSFILDELDMRSLEFFLGLSKNRQNPPKKDMFPRKNGPETTNHGFGWEFFGT